MIILEILRRSIAIVLLAAAPPGGTTSASSLLTLVDGSEPGQRLTLLGQVVDATDRPIAAAQMRVFQTDVTGHYTQYKPMDEAHARLSGFVNSDARGRFELRTIRPGGYPKAIRLGDRERKIPAHVHIDISAAGHLSRRVQVVFADDPLLADPYWQDWAKQAGHPVVSVTHEGAAQVAKVTLRLQLVAPH